MLTIFKLIILKKLLKIIKYSIFGNKIFNKTIEYFWQHVNVKDHRVLFATCKISINFKFFLKKLNIKQLLHYYNEHNRVVIRFFS